MFPSSLSVSGLQFGIDHSTLPGWIICGVLAVLSIWSWAVLASKWHLLARALRANRKFSRLFRESSHPLTMFLTRERVELSPLYHIYHAACRELAFYLVGEDEPGRTFASRLQGAGRITPSQMGVVRNAMERAVGEAALRLERRLATVATVLAAAPMLGLLGTVWGVMDCFADLVKAGQGAGLAALSPGIAAALLTTVMALLVAVPSLVGYNILVARIRALIVRMDNFASELSGLIDRHFVNHSAIEEPLPSLGALGLASMPAFSSAPSPPAPVNLQASEG